MITDYHTHVLPGIDDGSGDSETSLEMLRQLKEQGIERVIATPHFYAHKEKSVEDFIEKRRKAYDSIKNDLPLPVVLGAEIAIEHGISEVKDIDKLAIEGTKMILLELPYRGYKEWMSEEIYNISAEYGLKVVLAHIHRYIDYYSDEQMNEILKTDAVFQINNEAFESLSLKSFVKSLLKSGVPLVFGSDAHNLTNRKPNWKILKKKRKMNIIEETGMIFDKYKL
ncbi:MAG: CpsB/CapC family capsule biosynthesis tyrosine phosphatase [Ruminococcus sp.]